MIISNVGNSYVVHPESVNATSGKVSASFMNGAINWKSSAGFNIEISGELGPRCNNSVGIATIHNGIYYPNKPAYYSTKFCTSELRNLNLSDQEIANTVLTSMINGYSKMLDNLLLDGNGTDLPGILNETVGYSYAANFVSTSTGADVIAALTNLINNATNLDYNTGSSVYIYINTELFMKLKAALMTSGGSSNSFVVTDTILNLNDSEANGGGKVQFKVKPIVSDTRFILVTPEENLLPILDSFTAEATPMRGEPTLSIVIGGAASYIIANPQQVLIAK